MTHKKSITDALEFLGKTTEVTIDRPLGSKHPKHNFEYKSNYGYVPNTLSPDGEELDVYYLGVKTPLNNATGKCVAVIHRLDDNDDKLVVTPEDLEISDEEIEKQTHFQEQWFRHEIIRKEQ